MTIVKRECRNARYVQANSRLFRGIPQFPTPFLSYDTCNTTGISLLSSTKRPFQLGTRVEPEIAGLQIFSRANLNVPGPLGFRRKSYHLFKKKREKREVVSLKPYEQKGFLFSAETRPVLFPYTSKLICDYYA